MLGVGGGGGQNKMYKSIIFINLNRRSKKLKPKMLSCVLEFSDQLERRHCKDTQNFWLFCIRAILTRVKKPLIL
jgi:hypothetical protein